MNHTHNNATKRPWKLPVGVIGPDKDSGTNQLLNPPHNEQKSMNQATQLIPNTGYIFNFQQGAYSPNGKVGELSQEQIDAHNKALAEVELKMMIESGTGILYLTLTGEKLFDCCASSWTVSQWSSGWQGKVSYRKTSFHNMAGKNGRTDVWFTGPDGKQWHGVNIGDSQLCRVHRLKRQ